MKQPTAPSLTRDMRDFLPAHVRLTDAEKSYDTAHRAALRVTCDECGSRYCAHAGHLQSQDAVMFAAWHALTGVRSEWELYR